MNPVDSVVEKREILNHLFKTGDTSILLKNSSETPLYTNIELLTD